MSPECELARLYDEHASALFAFLRNLTRSEADTRDLLQDLFIKLARQPTDQPKVVPILECGDLSPPFMSGDQSPE